MRPAQDGGFGPTAAVLAATLLVAMLVIAFVIAGGGFSHPIVTALTDTPAAGT